MIKHKNVVGTIFSLAQNVFGGSIICDTKRRRKKKQYGNQICRMSHVFDDKRVNRRNTGIYFISAL